MANMELLPYKRPSMFRRMSLANWKNSTDPQVYGRLELDAGPALEYAEEVSRETGVKITMTHMVARAVALALKANPGANAIIRWGRVYERKDVDVFLQVAIPGEKPDLSGVVIRHADQKSPAELARELGERASRVREGRDEELARTKKTLDLIPQFLYALVLWFIGVLQYTLNISLKPLKLPRDPFGSLMVTSVGSLGIPEAYAPLVPMGRVPIVIAVGAVVQKAWVVDGAVVPRPICTVCATFDHRIMDGFQAGKLARSVSAYLADPAKMELSQAS